jgi:hypothetical protein
VSGVIGGGLSLGGNTFTNEGTLTWNGGAIYSSGGGYPSGFFNAGTLNIVAGSVAGFATELSPGFDGLAGSEVIANTGTIDVQGPGTVVANAQWALDNFGVIHFTNGGVLEVSGSTDDSFLEDGGTLSGPGALQFDSQAEVDLAGSTAILKGAAVILADGGDLGGEGTLNGPGSFEWTGGQIGNEGGGTVVWGPSLVVDLSGNAPKSLCAPVVSEATVTWSGGDLGTFGDEPGEISNFGTFNVAGDLTMSGSGSTFNNVEGGTLAKTSGAGDLSILSTWSVINGGVLDAKTGTISLQSDAANRFDKGAILEGEVQIQGQVSVPQNLFLTAGSTLQIAANSSLNPTLFSANDSDGGQTLIEGAGTLEWSAGAIGGDNSAGAITISTPLVIDNNAADGEVIGTGLITTTGATVTWVGDGGIFFQGVTWDNNDTFDIHSDTFINGPGGTLTNSGSIVKSKSPGITTIDMTTVNTGTVTIESGELLYPNAAFRAYTQTRGVTLLDGGALSNATQGALSDGGDEPRELDIFGGSLEGFGTATAELNIYGVLSPGNAVVPVGSLRVLGDLTIEDGGEVDIDLGGTDAGELDTIDVSGNATFDGTLVVRLTGGYQIPSSGARFVVMNYADEVGQFTNIVAPAGTQITATYDATQLILQGIGPQTLSSSSSSSSSSGRTGSAASAAGSSASSTSTSSQASASGAGSTAAAGSTGTGSISSGTVGSSTAASGSATGGSSATSLNGSTGTRGVAATSGPSATSGSPSTAGTTATAGSTGSSGTVATSSGPTTAGASTGASSIGSRSTSATAGSAISSTQGSASAASSTGSSGATKAGGCSSGGSDALSTLIFGFPLLLCRRRRVV